MANIESMSLELLSIARAASSGRATHVFHASPSRRLVQVLAALSAGYSLSDHENPGESFIHVLSGEVRMTAGEAKWDLATGDHVAIPQSRHNLVALEDSTFLLTIARTGR